MDDLISRAAAIDALDELCDRECEYSKKQRSFMCGACHLGSAFDVIEQLPPAQPELIEQAAYVRGFEQGRTQGKIDAQSNLQPTCNQLATDCISRQVAIDAVYLQADDDGWWCGTAEDMETLLKGLPSAQPKPDEWCADCKEYDPEKRCCPRFNRVIRNALKDAQPERKKGKWIYEVQDRLEDETDDGRVYRKEKRWKCSECGYDKGFALYKPKDKFCVECGADMRGDLT